MDVEEKKKPVRERGLEYNAVEILLLSKAWISASENAIVGVSQRLSTFWESVSRAYNTLKEQHEQYMQRQSSKDQLRTAQLQRSVLGSDFSPESDDDVALFTLPSRNLNSLQQKWSKKIQPLVFKFIGVTNRYPRRSGEDKEAYYHRVHMIFLKENDGEKSFDLYRSAWEYLKEKPKFSVTCNVPSAKAKEVISIEDADDSNEQTTAERIRPLGRNSTKRKMEEDKILDLLSQRFKSHANSGSQQLTAVMEQMVNSVGAALSTWSVQQALNNCSSEIRRQYNDLLVKRQIELLAGGSVTMPMTSIAPNITPLQLNSTLNSVSTGGSSEGSAAAVTQSKADDVSDTEESYVSCSQLR